MNRLLWVGALAGLMLAAVSLARSAPVEAPEYDLAAGQTYGLREHGMGWGEIGHAVAIARRAGKPLSEILALRERLGSWGAVALDQGFTVGEVREEAQAFARRASEAELDARETKTGPLPLPLEFPLPDRDAPHDIDIPDAPPAEPAADEQGRTLELAQATGAEPQQVADLRWDGYSWDEARTILRIAAKTGVPVMDVEALRDSGMTWSRIADKLGIALVPWDSGWEPAP